MRNWFWEAGVSFVWGFFGVGMRGEYWDIGSNLTGILILAFFWILEITSMTE